VDAVGLADFVTALYATRRPGATRALSSNSSNGEHSGWSPRPADVTLAFHVFDGLSQPTVITRRSRHSADCGHQHATGAG